MDAMNGGNISARTRSAKKSLTCSFETTTPEKVGHEIKNIGSIDEVVYIQRRVLF